MRFDPTPYITPYERVTRYADTKGGSSMMQYGQLQEQKRQADMGQADAEAQEQGRNARLALQLGAQQAQSMADARLKWQDAFNKAETPEQRWALKSAGETVGVKVRAMDAEQNEIVDPRQPVAHWQVEPYEAFNPYSTSSGYNVGFSGAPQQSPQMAPRALDVARIDNAGDVWDRQQQPAPQAPPRAQPADDDATLEQIQAARQTAEASEAPEVGQQDVLSPYESLAPEGVVSRMERAQAPATVTRGGDVAGQDQKWAAVQRGAPAPQAQPAGAAPAEAPAEVTSPPSPYEGRGPYSGIPVGALREQRAGAIRGAAASQREMYSPQDRFVVDQATKAAAEMVASGAWSQKDADKYVKMTMDAAKTEINQRHMDRRAQARDAAISKRFAAGQRKQVSDEVHKVIATVVSTSPQWKQAQEMEFNLTKVDANLTPDENGKINIFAGKQAMRDMAKAANGTGVLTDKDAVVFDNAGDIWDRLERKYGQLVDGQVMTPEDLTEARKARDMAQGALDRTKKQVRTQIGESLYNNINIPVDQRLDAIRMGMALMGESPGEQAGYHGGGGGGGASASESKSTSEKAKGAVWNPETKTPETHAVEQDLGL
jgi:hypothetical protein